MREIIKARAMCSSFLLSAKTQNVQARFSIVNGLEASSNTTSAKPHEFFDHTRSRKVSEYYPQAWGTRPKKGNLSRVLIILTFYTLREIERSGLRVEAIPNPPNVATPCYTLENLFPDWSFQKKTNRCEVHYEV
jgi:hypothetical protein